MFDAPTETAKNPIPMLYQSGYLTIKSSKLGSRFVLGFPNDEVRLGFLKALMPYYAMEKENLFEKLGVSPEKIAEAKAMLAELANK